MSTQRSTPGAGPAESKQHAQRRSLAGAIGPQESDCMPLFNPKVQGAEREPLTVLFGYTGEFEGDHAAECRPETSTRHACFEP